MKKKVILGIHGLGNKPPKLLLEEWWRLSLQEGLGLINCKEEILNFELVYWADVLHPLPLDIHESDDDEEDFLDERYVPATENKSRLNTFTDTIIHSVKEQLNNIIFNEKLHVSFPSITDFVIKHFFQDLSIYFTADCTDENDTKCKASEMIKERLRRKLLEHSGKEIFLIAHSMGSIIAYDILAEMKDEICVNTFITIGSPLGVPFIYKKLKDEHAAASDKLYVPECISKGWYNFADLNDKLAVNYKFEEMFLPNSRGLLAKSAVVYNNYQSDGESNPHKSFGYLRTRQLAALLEDFLLPRRKKIGNWFMNKLSAVMQKFKFRD